MCQQRLQIAWNIQWLVKGSMKILNSGLAILRSTVFLVLIGKVDYGMCTTELCHVLKEASFTDVPDYLVHVQQESLFTRLRS